MPDARDLDVLIPTRDRPAALPVTLAGLAARLRVMERYGGAGPLPSPAYQPEPPATVLEQP